MHTVPPAHRQASLALLLGLLLAGSASAEPGKPAANDAAKRPLSSPVVFGSRSVQSLVPTDPVLRPDPLRPPRVLPSRSRFLLEAESAQNAPHRPRAKQHWRVLLGWRWSY